MSDDRHMSEETSTPDRGDAGFSLIELMVTMSLMSVIMLIVTGAIVEVYSDVNRADGLSTARDQIGNSFRRLDKELRYATWVNTPGQVGGAWYLEYATSSTTCAQLAFQNGTLTRAEWNISSLRSCVPP